jgi:hypothetical protein
MKRIRTCAALLLAGAASAGASEVTNFARSTFDLSESTREAHTKPLNGTEGGLVFILNGNHPQTGNCLEFRWFTPVPSTIYGIAFLQEATWNPATDGAILRVSIGMAAVQLDPNETTVQTGRFFIEQDGRYYFTDFGAGGVDPVEVFFESDLEATDFREVFFNSDQPSDPNSNPDFSENGAPMRFGFGQGFAFFEFLVGMNIKTGLDNFSLQIEHEAPSQPSCPADFDQDGTIELDDLNVVLVNFGDAVAPWTDGDTNGDGFVDLDDLNNVLTQFGNPCP